MTKIVVTSFSDKGFVQYGQNFLERYAKHWKVPCAIFFEGNALPDYLKGIPEIFRCIPLESVHKWREFEMCLEPFPIMGGQCHDDYYTIQFDARMARKTFVQSYAVREFGGKVFWLDADTHTFADVPPEFLDEVLPDDKLCCFLGRDGGKIDYTESGFLGFNSRHPQCDEFMHIYETIFREGLIFTQRAWHDCIAFDMVRKRYPPNIFNNLSGDFAATHPFVNSVLGKYMDHLKGRRKELGHSAPEDLIQQRPEEYWKEIGSAKTETPPSPE